MFTPIKIRVGYLPHFNGYRVRAEAYRRATVPGSVAIAVRVQMRSRTGRAGPVGAGKFPWLVRLPSCSAAARRPACRLYLSGGLVLLGARRVQHPAPFPVLAASRGGGLALRGV